MSIKPLVLAVSVAFAGIAVQTAAETQVQPSVQTQGQISFLSGGVGDDEAVAMKQAAASYPLRLQFVRKASPRDEFLSDVKVTIRNRSREVVLDTVSNGPFFLAKLPPGAYTIEASYEDVVKRQTVNVSGGKQARAAFVWATRPDDASNVIITQEESR